MAGYDCIPSLFWLFANITHTVFLVVSLSTGNGIIKEEGDSQEKPGSEKPSHGHD
jgi:hypothetical protein